MTQVYLEMSYLFHEFPLTSTDAACESNRTGSSQHTLDLAYPKVPYEFGKWSMLNKPYHLCLKQHIIRAQLIVLRISFPDTSHNIILQNDTPIEIQFHCLRLT